MKEYLEKMKEKIKEIIKVVKWIINTSMVLTFIIVPFLHNVIDNKIAHLVWYPSCVFHVISFIYDYYKTKNSEENLVLIFVKNLGAVWMVPIFTFAFLINYYNIDNLILWIIFLFLLGFLPISLWRIFLFDCKQNNRTEHEIKDATVNFIKHTIQLWLYDLLYLSIFNEWSIATYIFGIIAMVIIFYNLTKAFIQGVQSLQLLLVFDFIFGVGLSIYLMYSIQNEILQSIVVNIVAAVYGGILTLVGVAWTIKKSEDDKKENLRLNSKPWLFVHRSVPWEKRRDYTKYYFACLDDVGKEARHFCVLKNTDNGIAILKRIISEQYDYYPLNDSIIDKKGVVDIMVQFKADDNKQDIRIVVEDVLGYEYVYKIVIDEATKIVQGLEEEQFDE